MITDAFNFAKEKHKGQIRDDGTPYFSHCVSTALNAIEDQCSVEDIIIALLHDTIEDTDVTEDELNEKFGASVARMVNSLSKIQRGKKISKEEYYKKLRSDPNVVRIKAYDRLANIFSLFYCPDKKKVKRYTKATKEELIPLIREYHPELAQKLSDALEFILKRLF